MFVCVPSAIKNVPMIPLGLKETKDVDMKPVFRVSGWHAAALTSASVSQ